VLKEYDGMVLEGLLSDMKAYFKKNEHKTSYIIASLFPIHPLPWPQVDAYKVNGNGPSILNPEVKFISK
jgi:hypothetical protein